MSFSSVSLESWDCRSWGQVIPALGWGEPLLVAHESFRGTALRGKEGRDAVLAGRVCDSVCSCTVLWFTYLQLGWGLLKKRKNPTKHDKSSIKWREGKEVCALL